MKKGKGKSFIPSSVDELLDNSARKELSDLLIDPKKDIAEAMVIFLDSKGQVWHQGYKLHRGNAVYMVATTLFNVLAEACGWEVEEDNIEE